MVFRKLNRVAVLAGAGAAVAYLFDPRSGRGRRARLRDQVDGATRRMRREAETSARYAEGKIEGAKATAAGAGRTTPADDGVITNEVKAALAALDFPTTDVNIEVVDGVVTLRGQVRTPEQVTAVEAEVAKVAGVKEVKRHLHLPETVAPNKADAVEASRSDNGSTVHHGA